MFDYLIFNMCVYILPISLFFLFDFHKTVTSYGLIRYNRFKKLTNFISSTSVGSKSKNFKIIWISLVLLVKSLLYTFIHKLNKNVIKRSDGFYEVSYYIRGLPYKMLISSKPSDIDVLQILDENMDDCTDFISQYAGPYNDFHGRTFTPEFFGKKELTFTMSDDNDYKFTLNQGINISNL